VLPVFVAFLVVLFVFIRIHKKPGKQNVVQRTSLGSQAWLGKEKREDLQLGWCDEKKKIPPAPFPSSPRALSRKA